MQLKIKQKYFTIGNRFQISDGKDRPLFYAEEELLRLRKNINLFDLNGNLLYHLEARFGHIFSYFAILKNGVDIGAIDEIIHFPFIKRARLSCDGAYVFIRSGPLRLKAYEANEKWKFDRKSPIAVSNKKLMKISDTYTLEFDEKRISVPLAALIGLWYDMHHNGTQH